MKPNPSNEDRIQSIIDKHPLLYPTKICFECWGGWLDIIERLSDDLESLLEDYIAKYSDYEIIPQCIQVKEKYGTLRFYMSAETDEMSRLIDAAETESSKTCEICGKPGKMNNGPWYTTLCPEHMH